MTENKLTTVAFKCHESEHRAIRDMAAAAGCSVSKFVRNAVLRAVDDRTKGDRLSVDDAAQDRPLVLTPATQDKLVRGLFMLIIDRHLQLKDEGREEHLADILKRAQALFDEAQTGADASSGEPPREDGG